LLKSEDSAGLEEVLKSKSEIELFCYSFS